MGRDANAVAASYVNLTEKQKDAFAGNLKDPGKERRKNYQGANPRMDMRRTEIVAEEQAAKVKDFIAEQSAKKKVNFDRIVREAEAKAQKGALVKIKSYRDVLSEAGIESKAIGDVVGTTWLEGLREGNSLLDITKNTFKNVLVSISDTLVKKSAELLVERLFVSLGNKKIAQQNTLNAATAKQGDIMQGLISKASTLFSSMGGSGIGGKLKGIGSIFGSMFSGGGGGGAGGGSNLAGIGSAKGFFGMNKGGVVPGGAPYTDRVPTMLTPGEVVIPRNKVDKQSGGTNITNINISGNVDDRAISQIKMVIAQSSAEVGGANRSFGRNTAGLRGRG